MVNYIFMYYNRLLENEVLESIGSNLVTAILGPRQCGKSTLAPVISKGSYFALEDTGISRLLVIAPVEKGWQKSEKTFITTLAEAVTFIKDELNE